MLLLQPRRIAARSVAARIADEMGAVLGDAVVITCAATAAVATTLAFGCSPRAFSPAACKTIPIWRGGAVILDEFHERSLQVDIALAWVAELRRTLRPDLKLVVMSATIDPQPVSDFLEDCPVVQAAGRQFPIATHYAPSPPRTSLVRQADGVRRALKEVPAGDVLAFLPGVGEIHGCMAELADVDAEVVPLHGSLKSDEQDAALRGSATRRRVICATNVAETSLTIEGIRAVVDGGMHRVMRFDPERGLPVLRLERISQWNADQRAGRSGRTAEGWCLRCWSRLINSGFRNRRKQKSATPTWHPLRAITADPRR